MTVSPFPSFRATPAYDFNVADAPYSVVPGTGYVSSTTGNMAEDSYTLTDTNAAFTAGDVGKGIIVELGVWSNPLITTIAGYSNAQTVTLTNPCEGTYAVNTNYLYGDSLDAQPGIQAAIDACYAAAGGTVYCPPGTYLLMSGKSTSEPYGHLVVKAGVTLIGAGPASTTFVNGQNHHSTLVNWGASNTGVQGLKLVYPPGYSNGTGDGMKYAQGDYVTVYNCEAHGYYPYGGFVTYGMDYAVFDHCKAYDNGQNLLFSPSSGVNNHCTMVDCESHNTLGANGTIYGFRVVGENHNWGEGDDPYCESITFTRCYDYGSYVDAFLIQHVNNLVMNTCVCDETDNNKILLCGVTTGHLTSCVGTVNQATAVNEWSGFYNQYGPCTGITED